MTAGGTFAAPSRRGTAAARYRLRQGVRALTASARPLDMALAARTLTPGEYGVFRRLRRGECQHSLDVLRALREQGDTSPALATAALLHDAGKARCPLSVAEKSLAVLIRTFAPTLFGRWSHRGDLRWPILRACVVYAQHPGWSADLMRAVGSPPDAIWLAAHHADDAAIWRGHALYEALMRLQAADDTN